MMPTLFPNSIFYDPHFSYEAMMITLFLNNIKLWSGGLWSKNAAQSPLATAKFWDCNNNNSASFQLPIPAWLIVSHDNSLFTSRKLSKDVGSNWANSTIMLPTQWCWHRFAVLIWCVQWWKWWSMVFRSNSQNWQSNNASSALHSPMPSFPLFKRSWELNHWI